MLNNDFKYFTGRTETSNHENQNNKKFRSKTFPTIKN